MLTIRQETPADYQAVERLTRQAFYNVYMPGCVEHYLVHTMRHHADFMPELADVLVLDGQIIANIMYTKAQLTTPTGEVKRIVTFGPLSVAPAFQRQGYGKRLLTASFEKVQALGYPAIVIFGDPNNYVGRGFKSCHQFQVSLPDGKFPAAMLVKELVPGTLAGRSWHYLMSPVMAIDEAAAQAYDAQLPAMKKQWQPSQEAFKIMSQAYLEA
ncbi:GNAT family N-acetyltransferase [Lactiplantibacillus songbeiensis]|uniref:GNAT family N-acetyltransferase n=1 Tax=Lactiplantibacillus songbeiensis TaxID=2559920 RepID=A0ABW4C0Y8_9LACO|nr:N-acetyltransferase [Lactiplantibacillus songbeiensis]